VFPDEQSRLSSTWGAGDLLSSAMGVVTIDAIEEHDLMDNATRRGRAFEEHLRGAGIAGVTDVRGEGLTLAVELFAAAADTAGAGVRQSRVSVGTDTGWRTAEPGHGTRSGVWQTAASRHGFYPRRRTERRCE
jgi:acetylornithine/succinyldiaminopimelate/putrescine aminotransferase